MLTRTQKDDLRFVGDCLTARGEQASQEAVLALAELSPILAPLLPVSRVAREAFLAQACRLLVEAVEGPGPARERLRGFGRRCGPALFTPQAFQALSGSLARILSSHLGPAFSPRVQTSCEAGLVAAVGFLQDGVSDAAMGPAQDPAG